MSKRFLSFSTNAVAALFTCTLTFLALVSAISTCMMKFTLGNAEGEHTFFIADSIFLNVGILLLFITAIYFTHNTRAISILRNNLKDDIFFKKCKAAILFLLFLLSSLWIGLTLAIPDSDQGAIQAVVILAQKGDWSYFTPDQYMGRYPHQYGLFWISMLLATVFGKYTAGAFQIFNIGGLLVIASTLGELASRMGATRLQQLATMCLCFVFFPLVQYVTFVYGLIWGLALALLAIKYEMDFFKTSSLKFAVFSALCIGLSILFKHNYTIFFIGMALYVFIEIVDTHAIKKVVLLAFMAISLLLTSYLPVIAVEKVSGLDITEGESSWSWIAMGLHEGERAPGWYDAYNKYSYKEAGYDTEVQTEMAKKDISHSLKQFASGERNPIRFFTQKAASQWNNPTFQASWVMQGSHAALPVHAPIAAFLSARGTYNSVIFYLNPLQFLLLIGALAWVLLSNWKQPTYYEKLVLPLIFVGGFICHLFWEGKCQYALPYFITLFPFAPMGFARIVTSVKSRISKKESSSTTLGVKQVSFVVSITLTICILFANGYQSLVGDEEEFYTWMEANPECAYIANGPYLAEAMNYGE